MKTEGKVTISRVISNVEDSFIEIQIEDVRSHIEFIKVKLSLENFARLITNQAAIDCLLTLKGLENIGKKKINKDLIFEIPPEISFSNKTEWCEKNSQQFCDDGFTSSTYFRSQNSFFQKDGKSFARTHQFKYEVIDE